MTVKTLTPSAYMRERRPENYSDTTETTDYVLDRAVFDHHLEKITTLGQTQDFEIFCRKLCERTICPNLRPHTGPDGGGDSKADTETLPVADEIATLTYAGEANAGREMWAFAFSAKEDWRGKVRSDVKGIANTGRGYDRIIFVTSRYAPDKARANVETELTAAHGVKVTIYDRSWIIEQVIDHGRKDLAHNYLNVGQEVKDANRLGPADYSRQRQLDAIEKLFDDPDSFSGMERQSATEALLAAKISRTLERPRLETDGRFQRAIRLADAHGLHRQKLEARYERLWTAVWWFDDFAELNTNYAAFEAEVIGSDHVINLEFLANLLQMLAVAVMQDHMTAVDCDFEARSARLRHRLQALAVNTARPTNALEARTLLALDQVNEAMYRRDSSALSAIWPEFSSILAHARGLGEYDFRRFVKLIDAVGTVAGDDPGYDALVEEVAEFVGERSSEGEGALILLSRAEKLNPDSHFMSIRLLGKAARKLTKKEYGDSLVRALQLLSIAYRAAGLLWASRATAIFAAASIAIQGEADSELDVSIVPTVALMAWNALQLRHLPDFLESIRFLNGCLVGLPLTEESKALLSDRLKTFDTALGSNFLNSSLEELQQLADVPDVLEALGLFAARFGLLYALGYDDLLRTDGSIPPDEPADALRSMANILASQPVSDDIQGPLVTNAPGRQRLESTVVGMTVEIAFEGTTTSTLVAEAILSSIEATFATALDLRIHPHTERYSIGLIEDAAATEPSFDVDPLKPEAKLIWPKDMALTAFDRSTETICFLTQASFLTMSASCVLPEGIASIDRLANDEGVLDRISMISITPNSFHRLFSKPLSSLGEYGQLVRKAYPPRDDRPLITRGALYRVDDELPTPAKNPETWYEGQSHRDLQIKSVIDYNLWNAATWEATVYTSHGPQRPPGLGIVFKDETAGRAIFERWRERFGAIDREDEIYLSILRNVSDAEPTHYDVLLTSNHTLADVRRNGSAMVISRYKRMEPATNWNLEHFLADYNEAGVFLFFPAVMVNGEPRLLFDAAVLKRNLRVKSAKALSERDIEQVCLGKRSSRPNGAPVEA